ncbi:larval cuticle protein LCP-30-like [Phlebotomus argentipes]|uniref:larval cuticle protein LCP-30-like n=1 Tax=Phlebotomus argentipes TaxID=94469 RepID=UPI00289353CD|nr:larval cuticle protein LCP-30-like [Phlebotomus argentipes]
MREISGLWLVILAALLLVDSARGQTTRRTALRVDDGRYRPANDGRYRPGNDGRYIPNDDGKYVHVGDGSRGPYTGGGGEYVATRAGNFDEIDRFGVTASPASAVPFTTAARVLVTAPPRPATPPPRPSTVAAPVVPRVKVVADGRPNGEWQTLRHESEVNADGYHYLFETENGILAEESGRVENDDVGLRSQGFYQYTGDDGQLYRVDYVAGPEGFVAQGDHIPKVPPEIEKLLAYLAAHPPTQ